MKKARPKTKAKKFLFDNETMARIILEGAKKLSEGGKLNNSRSIKARLEALSLIKKRVPTIKDAFEAEYNTTKSKIQALRNLQTAMNNQIQIITKAKNKEKMVQDLEKIAQLRKVKVDRNSQNRKKLYEGNHLTVEQILECETYILDCLNVPNQRQKASFSLTRSAVSSTLGIVSNKARH